MMNKLFLIPIFLLLPLPLWANCLCPDGIGARKGDKPFMSLVSKDEKRSMVLCGYVIDRRSSSEVIASEFDVVACREESIFLSFGALENVRVEQRKNSIRLIELKKLPPGFGRDWIFMDYQFRDIRLGPKGIVSTKKKIVFQPPRLSRAEQKQILKLWNHQKPEKKGSEELMGLLFLGALSGNKEIKKKFLNVRYDFRVDGVVAHVYGDVMRIYTEYLEFQGGQR